ncbi:MAG: hypothetical protein RL322_2308 [Pseudomonadota bacterium]|jgi:hypothetical protein
MRREALGLYRELLSRQSLLTHFALLMLALALPTTLLLALDDRIWREVAIWAKPLKFMLSTAAFAVTTAWFIGLLPEAQRTSTHVRRLVWVLIITASFEVGYISLQAALGQGSHHYVGDPLHAALFGLMALAAVGLTATQAVLASLIWRHASERDTVFVQSVVAGLLVTFVLATASGFMLGGQQPPPGVGLPVVGWHIGQPDARPAHFLGVHAHQFIPLAGWLLQRYQTPRPGAWLVAVLSVYVLAWATLTAWALPGARA